LSVGGIVFLKSILGFWILASRVKTVGLEHTGVVTFDIAHKASLAHTIGHTHFDAHLGVSFELTSFGVSDCTVLRTGGATLLEHLIRWTLDWFYSNKKQKVRK